jgi:hypothetical protein
LTRLKSAPRSDGQAATFSTGQGAMGNFTPPLWEAFAHDADIGVRGYGFTPDEAFANAALGMMPMVTDPGAGDRSDPRRSDQRGDSELPSATRRAERDVSGAIS